MVYYQYQNQLLKEYNQMFNETYIEKCNALNISPKTQDELVELCKNLSKYKDKSYLQLLSNFRIGIGKMCCSSYLETQSLNDLWLMFYMMETEGKIWVEGQHKWLPLNKYSKKSLS